MLSVYRFLCLLACAAAISPLCVMADALSPPPLPGWSHEPFSSDTPQGHGIQLEGGVVNYSSPVIADIDGNPANGLEAAVGGAGSKGMGAEAGAAGEAVAGPGERALSAGGGVLGLLGIDAVTGGRWALLSSRCRSSPR